MKTKNHDDHHGDHVDGVVGIKAEVEEKASRFIVQRM